MGENRLNHEVTAFLDGIDHPLRAEIDRLRGIILSAGEGLAEGIKWNGPNYSVDGEDRITLKIHPPKQIQIIFHRGAKVKEQPAEKLLKGEYPFLAWKENDRAVATFRSMEEIERHADLIREAAAKWIEAT
jgi:Domain of unknown function (DU1801).